MIPVTLVSLGREDTFSVSLKAIRAIEDIARSSGISSPGCKVAWRQGGRNIIIDGCNVHAIEQIRKLQTGGHFV